MVKIKNTDVLFVHPIWATNLSFVLSDIEILSRKYSLQKISYTEGDFLFPLRLLRRLIKAKISYCWFGGIHSFWAVVLGKMFGRKTIIISGGYDTVYMPEIEYGIRFEKKAWRRCYWSLRHADKTIAFSSSARIDLINEARVKSPEPVYIGFNISAIPPGKPWNERENSVATVCHMTISNIKRKGLNTLINVAKYFSNVKFIFIGRDAGAIEILKKNSPENVVFTEYIDDENKYTLLGNCKIYAQLSAHEGFGCALAEAMACGCIPVITDRGSLPEVVGRRDTCIPYGDVDGAVSKIHNILSTDNSDLSNKMRERVLLHFSLACRQAAIGKLIDSLW